MILWIVFISLNTQVTHAAPVPADIATPLTTIAENWESSVGPPTLVMERTIPKLEAMDRDSSSDSESDGCSASESESGSNEGSSSSSCSSVESDSSSDNEEDGQKVPISSFFLSLLFKFNQFYTHLKRNSFFYFLLKKKHLWIIYFLIT